MRTQTLFISFDKLCRAEGAVTVVTLALVCNDLAIANSSMGRYKQSNTALLTHVRRGGRMYFARMMCGHLNEGLEAIKQIRETPSLAQLVSQCSPGAQEAFATLCECLPEHGEHNRFEKYVDWVRNRVAFHYSPNDIDWAMHDRAKRPVANISGLTAGEDIHSTRFEFGDDLLDSVVVRKLWKIPRDKNLREEADAAANWCDMKCREFLQFSQEFVPLFLRRHALAS